MNAGGERRIVDVVTGTRAEFGLLRSVMRAIDNHEQLQLRVLVTGTHLLPPAKTINEVERDFAIAATIPMQRDGTTGRLADVAALGRGISGFADWWGDSTPDFVVVLGDRIEAFAAASSAAIAGIRIAHLHGGDRAEGIADESLRHAITKLAHVHLPASETSAARIIAMGEESTTVHLVGSPALDDLDTIEPLDDDLFTGLGAPAIIFLHHPIGRSDDTERAEAASLLDICTDAGTTLALHPNHDPGRSGIVEAIKESGCLARDHLPRAAFIGLLRRARVIVGNSSAGLIECAPLGVRCVNVGSRQAGREMPGNVSDIHEADPASIAAAIDAALAQPRFTGAHPYGVGASGAATADILASLDLAAHPLRKRNAY